MAFDGSPEGLAKPGDPDPMSEHLQRISRSIAEAGDQGARAGFYVGWLDAIWSGFTQVDHVDVPGQIKRELIRHGYLKPVPLRRKKGGTRYAITKAGMRIVLVTNRELGIDRPLYGPDDEPVDIDTWLAEYEELGPPPSPDDDPAPEAEKEKPPHGPF